MSSRVFELFISTLDVYEVNRAKTAAQFVAIAIFVVAALKLLLR